ncbi:MAG TPA: hypothetical protein VFU63_04380 [Ktedonobacterales bacterium]|nr:hypothetical protein [Ktedonobacterales bacterium]
MFRQLARGIIARATGTTALNIATYLDMALRGRPSSEVPANVVGSLTQSMGIPLEAEAHGQEQVSGEEKAKAQHRLSGIGALMGYATGLGVGALYGLVRPFVRRVPLPLMGLALGAAAMASSDVPAAITGATNPKTWGTAAWASDIIPHAIYGMVTVLTCETYADD